MNSKSSLVGIALLSVAATVVGCKDSTPAPTPEPKPESSALAINPRPRLNLKTPLTPMPKVDPQTLKEYRADVCFFGSLALRQARDAYLGSLGKDEPSEKKIPSFGGAPTPVAQGPLKAAPGVVAKPGAAPPERPAPERGRGDMTVRAPYERNARACVVASNVKEPAMSEVDTAIAAFAPFSLELSKTIATASAYYQREEYKADKFAKGKALHKQLVEQFAKLAGLQDKVGDAIVAYRKEHAVDTSKLSDGEKAVRQAVEDARALMMGLLAKKVDPAAYKAQLDKLTASVAALKTAAAANPSEPWEKVVLPSLEALVKHATELKVTDKPLSGEDVYAVAGPFTSVIEANQRATSRALVAKAKAAEPVAAPAEPAAPAPAHE
jgi:hypothetical protein